MKKPHHLLPLVFLPLFLLLYYASLFYFIRPEAAERDIASRIEQLTDAEFTYNRFHLSLFPIPGASFEGVAVDSHTSGLFAVKAEKLRLYFSWISPLFGRMEVSGIHLDHAEGTLRPPGAALFEQIHLDNLRVRVKSAAGNAPRLKARWEASIEGIPESLQGTLEGGWSGNWDSIWGKGNFNGGFSVKNFPARKAQALWGNWLPFQVREGLLSGDFTFKKEEKDPWASLAGQGELKSLAYEFEGIEPLQNVPAMDLRYDFDFAWQASRDELYLRRGVLETPVARIQAGGVFTRATREFREARFTLSGISLENLPLYYPPFQNTIPFNLGFSGKSDLEMSLEGTLDHLALHANWDLTPTLLTYASFFVKPKDIPLNLAFDFLLKDSRMLSGDFSLRLQEATLKGTLTGVDMVSGEGQVNVLSNKFKLDGWEALIPPFERYHVEGDIKILANLTGNFLKHPGGVKSMLNVTLERGSVVRRTLRSAALHDIFLSMDFSDVLLQVKQAEFRLGDMPMRTNFLIYNPSVQSRSSFSLSADKLDVPLFFSTMEKLGAGWMPAFWTQGLRTARTNFVRIFPEGEMLEKVVLDFGAQDNKYTLETLRFGAYGGWAKVRGDLEWNENRPLYHVDAELDRVSFARLFARLAPEKRVMAGNLFLKADLQGSLAPGVSWRDNLAGGGLFSITNGEFYGFSVLKTLAEMKEFTNLTQYVSDGTSFDEIRSSFALDKGKITTDKLLLVSRDATAVGSGEITAEGLLNYRLEVFLPRSLAETLLETDAEKLFEREGNQFGPVPLLLSGAVESPELKTDPEEIGEFEENMAKRKSGKLVRQFLPEDFFFDTPANS